MLLVSNVSATTYTISPTGSNDQIKINSVLSSANSGDTIVFGNGNFDIRNTVACTGKSLNFRGSGSTTFTLNVPPGENEGSGGFYIGGTAVSKNVKLKQNSLKGTKTVYLPSVSNYRPGDLILIWNNVVWAPIANENDYPDQLTGEMYRISAVDSATNSVTLNEPLLRDYTISASSQANIYRPVTVKIENINFIAKTDIKGDYQGVGIQYCADSSITNCIIQNNGYENLGIWRSWKTTVSGCTIANANLDGCAYGVAIWSGSAYTTITGCDISNCRHQVTANSDERNSLTRNITVINNKLTGASIAGSNVVDSHVDCIDMNVNYNDIYINNAYWLFAYDHGAQYSWFIGNTIHNGNGGVVAKRGAKESSSIVIKDNTIINTMGDGYQGINVKCPGILFDYENNTKPSRLTPISLGQETYQKTIIK